MHFQGKREQIEGIKEDPGLFQELGILIDPEVAKKTADINANVIIITIIIITIVIIIFVIISYLQVGEGRTGDCLLQIFSTPLFAENTFFLEVKKSQKLQMEWNRR